MQWLKRIRVILAIVSLTSISLLYFDFGNNIPFYLSSFILSTQVFPTIIDCLITGGTISVVLILILLSTILFGRIYCSTLCPLGILQDIIIRAKKLKNRRNRYRFKKPYYLFHYSLFGISLLLLFFGSTVLINIFEPFSTYGRILSNLANPIVVLVNNIFGNLIALIGFINLIHIPLLHVSISSIIGSFSIFALVGYLAFSQGRMFCNLLCPVGAFLGILSRYSIFKIVIDEKNCKDCGLCERVCKAACIKSKERSIDFAACIGCFNCLDVCPTVGMSYKRVSKRSTEIPVLIDEKRRQILKNSVLSILTYVIPDTLNIRSEANKTTYDESRKLPIAPPGAVDLKRFSNYCTACHLCVNSCPTQVLFPSLMDYGFSGIFQPKMNYNASYCNYDCVICGNICPTGAILPLDAQSKKEIQIGKVVFAKDDCIVITKKKDCGACAEHCPTKAVRMVPFEKLMLPEVRDNICVGCGACEHACPVIPRKAIFVVSNQVHQKAQKPEIKKIEQSFDSTQEFPF